MTHKIQEGDLLVYLNGDSGPGITQTLQTSPELQAELNALQQVDTHLRQELSNADLFDTQDMINVVTGQTTEDQRLIFAAQIQRYPVIREETKILLAEYEQLISRQIFLDTDMKEH